MNAQEHEVVSLELLELRGLRDVERAQEVAAAYKCGCCFDLGGCAYCAPSANTPSAKEIAEAQAFMEAPYVRFHNGEALRPAVETLLREVAKQDAVKAAKAAMIVGEYLNSAPGDMTPGWFVNRLLRELAQQDLIPWPKACGNTLGVYYTLYGGEGYAVGGRDDGGIFRQMVPASLEEYLLHR